MAGAGEPERHGVSERWVDIAELSRIMGLSTVTIGKYVADGMPRRAHPEHRKRWQYDPDRCIEWRRLHGRRRGMPMADRLMLSDGEPGENGEILNGQIPPLRVSEEKLAHYKAQMAELDLAVKQGQYLEASEVGVEWTRRLTRMERMLMSRDRRLAPRICLALGVGPDKQHIVRDLLATDIAEAVAKATTEDDGDEP